MIVCESEAEFQNQVIDLAHLTGWLVHHTRPALNERGQWRTPIQGDPGFPDLVLSHPTKGTLFVELKSERGRLSEGQREWGERLAGSGLYRLWRPSDWSEVLAALKNG